MSTSSACPISEIVQHHDLDPSIIQRIAHRTVVPQLTISPPDPSWPTHFAVLKRIISDALGPIALSITHVGSTSVPDLPAKPVIDIDVSVLDPSLEQLYVPQLEAAGFQFLLREPEWMEHRFFAISEMKPYYCNLHVFKEGTAELIRHRVMREWLCENGEDRERYAAVKMSAAEETNQAGEKVQDYNQRKESVVRGILDRAFRARGWLPAEGKQEKDA